MPYKYRNIKLKSLSFYPFITHQMSYNNNNTVLFHRNFILHRNNVDVYAFTNIDMTKVFEAFITYLVQVDRRINFMRAISLSRLSLYN
jgi:hypothetical protein